MPITEQQLQQLYIAYFGRPPEIEFRGPGQTRGTLVVVFEEAAEVDVDAWNALRRADVPATSLPIIDKVLPAGYSESDQHRAHQRAVNVLGPRRGRWK